MLIDSLKEQVSNFFKDKTVQRVASAYLITYCLHRFFHVIVSWIYFPLPDDLTSLNLMASIAVLTLAMVLTVFLIAHNLLSSDVRNDYSKPVGLFILFNATANIIGLITPWYASPDFIKNVLSLGKFMLVRLILIYSAIRIIRKQYDHRLFASISLASFIYIIIMITDIGSMWKVIMSDFTQNFFLLIGAFQVIIYLILGTIAIIIVLETHWKLRSVSVPRIFQWVGAAILMDGLERVISIVYFNIINLDNFLTNAMYFSNNNFYYYYIYINPLLTTFEGVFTIIFAALMITRTQKLNPDGTV
jgi:hypothetical protein